MDWRIGLGRIPLPWRVCAIARRTIRICIPGRLEYRSLSGGWLVDADLGKRDNIKLLPACLDFIYARGWEPRHVWWGGGPLASSLVNGNTGTPRRLVGRANRRERCHLRRWHAALGNGHLLPLTVM